jgi:hypothetical protein
MLTAQQARAITAAQAKSDAAVGCVLSPDTFVGLCEGALCRRE